MLKSIAKIFSLHIVVKIIGLLTIALVLEFLSVNDFGKYSYFLVFLNLIAIIIDPFLSAYLVDSKTFNYKRYNLGIFLFSLILLPFFYAFTKLFNQEISFDIFILFCSTFLLSSMLKSFFNIREEFFKYGLIDVYRQLIIFLTTLFCFYFLKRNELFFLLKINYACTTLFLIILLPFYFKRSKAYIDLRFSVLKKLFVESKYLIFYTAIIPVFTYIDSYFIDRFLSEQDLGLYSFSLKVYNISLMLVIPIFTVLNIKQISIAKNKGYAQFLSKNIKKVIIFSILLFFCFFLTNYVLTNYIYLDYKSSFFNTTILLIGSFVAYLTIPFSFLIAYRKYKFLLFIALTAVFTNITLNYFFINTYGTTIVAISTALSQIIINLGAAVISYILLKEKK